MESEKPKLLAGGKKSCLSSAYHDTMKAAGGELRTICRRKPGKLFGQFIPNQAGQPILISQTAWPIVEKDAWCGEFSPQLQS